MKKLATLVLCTGVVILSIWSYNTAVQNAEATSCEIQTEQNKKDTIGKYVKEKLEGNKNNKIIRLIHSIEKEKLNNPNKVNTTQKEISKGNIPLYDIPLNIDIQKYIYEISKEKNIPHELILGVIKTESNFDPKAKNVNKNGSVDKGLMQINSIHEKWCKELGITNLYDPYQNIKFGSTLLANLYTKYKDVHKTLIAYNMGESNLRKNLKVGRSKTDYSRKVVKNINIILSSK